MGISDLYRKVEAGEITVDGMFNPGKYLHEVNTADLTIELLESGFPTLDQDYMLLKKEEGELIVVGGRPSIGKSAFMFQLAYNVSERDNVHVFSLEMSDKSIARRQISAMINKPVTAIQRGLVDPRVIALAQKDLEKYKFFVDDRSGLGIKALCDAAYNRAKTVPPALIVIDYLQLIRKDKGHSTDAEVGQVTQELKALAKNLKCPVIVGSQLNRQCEIRGNSSGDYRPMLSDLRESGNIEQDADVVLAVHREFKYTGLRAGEADILILKNRNGPVGEAVMSFYDAQTRFEDRRGSI